MAQNEEKIQMLVVDDVGAWVVNGPSPDMINKVDLFGEYIGHKLKSKQSDDRVSTSQIRQIFTKMKSIEAKGFKNPEQQMEFLMLKPYLAYAAKRYGKKGLDELKNRLTRGIEVVLAEENNEDEKAKRFKNFCRLFEAILAYHRAHGGS